MSLNKIFTSTNKLIFSFRHLKLVSSCVNSFPFSSPFIKCYSTTSKQEKDESADGSGIPSVGTIQEMTLKLAKIMGVKRGYKPMDVSRSDLDEYLPKSQNDLPPRTMKDSLITASVPLSTNVELQDRYITVLGYVRLGRLLEDMDIFAVYVVQKHISNPKLPSGKPSPYAIVTVLVDKIDFTGFLPKPTEDIRLLGHVSWVGRSSIEVVVWLDQMSQGSWRKLTRAFFLMAARHPAGAKSAPINPLVATNEEEKQIIASGEARKQRRQLLEKRNLMKVVPNTEEQQIIHNLFIRTINVNQVSLKKTVLPPGCAWMEDCTLSNSILSQPEHRNLHNTVFGGFLMRQAMELSWTLAYMFSRFRPTLKSISDISFNQAIDVSSLIFMHAHVVFTQMQFIQVTVYAEVKEASTGITSTTNAFHFTYDVPQLVPEVIPNSYQEAMMYIDGRRHLHHVLTHQEDVFKPCCNADQTIKK